MAEKLKEEEKAKQPKPLEIKFNCPRCGKSKPLEEMRSITRFLPVLVVCWDCEKELR